MTLILILIVGLQLSAQDSVAELSSDVDTGKITVEITGLSSDKGQLMVALYDSSSNWLKKRMMDKSIAIVNGQATVVFEEVPYGTYGISTYHDENNNGKLDTGTFGIPKEPYASSRGAKGMFGPPNWKDAIFDVNALTVTESIKY